MKDIPTPESEDLPLSKAALFLLEECRMVLPGMQALFGFQLIAVFNPRFVQLLSPTEQWLHLLAIGLVTLAVALIMTPAAYHRQTGPQQITQRFIRICTRLVLWSMPPLALSLCAEFYLISRIIAGSVLASLLAAAQFGVFFSVVYASPTRSNERKRQVGKMSEHLAENCPATIWATVMIAGRAALPRVSQVFDCGFDRKITFLWVRAV